MKSIANNTTGVTTSFIGTVNSPQGIAAIFNNNAGGPLASFRNSGVEKIGFDASGDVTAQGTVTGGTLVSTVSTGTAPLTVTSTTLVPNLNVGQLGGVASSGYAQLAVANTFTQPQTVNAGSSVRGLQSTSTYTGGAGIWGEDDTAHSSGFTGYNSAAGGYGVYAIGATAVYGSDNGANGSTGVGVYGISSAATGVQGASASGIGVYGTSSTGVAVEGYASDNYALQGYNTSTDSTHPTLLLQNADTTSNGDLVFETQGTGFGGTCTIDVTGNLFCTGSLAIMAKGANNKQTGLYTVSASENMVEDFGSGALQHGVARISLDPAFAEIASADAAYHVYLTPGGDCEGLYVTNRTATGFEVREFRGGKSNVGFDYRIVAHRQGFEGARLPDMTGKFKVAPAEPKASDKVKRGLPVPGAPNPQRPVSNPIANR
jgi:hypothetical protein